MDSGFFLNPRRGRIRGIENRDDGGRLCLPAAFRTVRRRRCSDSGGGNRKSTSIPVRCGRWGAEYAVCGICFARIPLFRHRRDSGASGRLLRCDTADRRKKCSLFDDKFPLRAILFPKGVDNSAFLWYKSFMVIESFLLNDCVEAYFNRTQSLFLYLSVSHQL